MSDLRILLYVPNVIGYIRLLFLGISWWFFDSSPLISLVMYSVYVLGDFMDGFAARKLNQCTAFGAWFDVVIDLFGRGMLWSRINSYGYLVSCVEWLCFVCTHTLGSQWKSAFVNEPFFVKAVMANGYSTPAGMFAIAGLHGLPMLLYGHYYNVLWLNLGVPFFLQYAGIGLLSAGRALCMAVELWVIYAHVKLLLSQDAGRHQTDTTHQAVS